MAPSTYYANKTRSASAGLPGRRPGTGVPAALGGQLSGLRRPQTAPAKTSDAIRSPATCEFAGITGARRGKRVRPAQARSRRAASRPGGARLHRHRPQTSVTDLSLVPTLGRRGLRLIHHRRLQPDDRGLAGRSAYTHSDGARRHRDGSLVRWKVLEGLRCHSDAECQFTSIRYGELRPFGMANASLKSARCPRSAPSATALMP